MTSADKPSLHPSYRADIDGLRAVAVLSVVVYHAFPARLAGGFTGVDIFFVISGFLISTIIFTNVSAGRFSFLDFFGRRVRRIFPALLLVLLVCYAFGWFALFADEFEELGKHIAAGAAFVSNLVLWNESGYFDAAAERKPLLHLWSLGIEEQFYIFWPLLAWLAWKVKRGFGIVIAIILLASFALNVLMVNEEPVGTFYSPLTRFWELLVGAALAWWTLRGKAAAKEAPTDLVAEPANAFGGRDVASIAGLALIGAALAATSTDAAFPGWWALLPTIGAALLIAAGPQAIFNRALLSRPLVVWFGLISYPLYLWHWPALYVARTMGIGEPSAPVRLVAVTIAIGLATLTYRYVEKPIRHSARQGTVTTVLVALMVVMGCLGYFTYRQEGFAFRYAASPNDLREREWHLRGEGVRDCSDILAGTPSSFCATTEQPIVALIGDSHAGALYHGMITNRVDPRYRQAVIMGAGSCQPTLGVESAPDCDRQLASAMQRVSQDPAIRTVILAGYFGFIDPLPAATEQRFLEGYGRTIDALRSVGKRVVFLVDNPSFKRSAEVCQPRTLPLRSIAGDDPAFCHDPQPADLKDQRRYLAFVAKLKARSPDVEFFDAKDSVCSNGRCPLLANGELLYGDDNHLSVYGSRRVADDLVRFLRRS